MYNMDYKRYYANKIYSAEINESDNHKLLLTYVLLENNGLKMDINEMKISLEKINKQKNKQKNKQLSKLSYLPTLKEVLILFFFMFLYAVVL